jgi:Na+/proline symporter
VGLASLVLYPELGPDEKRLGYVFAMRDHLPTGLKGMLVASFFAAYMSTIATQLNWGTSYVMNDFYKRFVNRQAGERDLVRLSRVMTVVLMVVSLVVTSVLDTISGAWAFIIEAGAGLGLVLILRWYWWRINAWSEIAAMVSSFAVAVAFAIAQRSGAAVASHTSLLVTIAVTTVVWVVATYVTAPTDRATLVAFYRLVRPGGRGWESVRAEAGVAPSPDSIAQSLLSWVLGCFVVYAALFGAGSFLYGRTAQGVAWSVVLIVAGGGLIRQLRREHAMTSD